jgi:mannose-6-phosphate isomerase-like protein (cupin superfamily)
MPWSRRDLCAALPIFVSLPAIAAELKATLPSKVYQFGKLPVHQGKNMQLMEILNGQLSQGLPISLHESDLGPFGVPHPPHRHHHEELILLMNGTLDFLLNGTSTRAEAGSVLFAGSNDEHGIRNAVEAHAKYFVLALGDPNS